MREISIYIITMRVPRKMQKSIVDSRIAASILAYPRMDCFMRFHLVSRRKIEQQSNGYGKECNANEDSLDIHPTTESINSPFTNAKMNELQLTIIMGRINHDGDITIIGVTISQTTQKASYLLKWKFLSVISITQISTPMRRPRMNPPPMPTRK